MRVSSRLCGREAEICRVPVIWFVACATPAPGTPRRAGSLIAQETTMSWPGQRRVEGRARRVGAKALRGLGEAPPANSLC